MTSVLALDVGTSSARARVYDERGGWREGTAAQAPSELVLGRGGRAELDADRLVEVARAVLDEARRRGGPVDAVAVSCFWHSLLPVGADGRPLGPLHVWQDTRAADQARRLAAQLDAEAVHRRTGCPLHPSYWPAALLRLAEERPGTFRAAERFLSFPDYLFHRLVGDARTSLSMASGTGLLELGTGDWDAELLEAIGVGPERLPEIADDPVSADVPWFRALGDGACSNVGVGCETPERAALMVGTSAALRVLLPADRATPRPGLFLYRLDRGHVVQGGALSDGGNLHAWLERTLRLPTGAAPDVPVADGHGLTFLPLLGGERAPGWSPTARGALVGLTFDTTPADIRDAALEGVAYRLAALAELLPGLVEVVATGGALRDSPAWVQVIADVLGRPVVASAVPEASARGAAVVALRRLGLRPDPAPLGAWFEPRPDRHETYRVARARQRDLYRRLHD